MYILYTHPLAICHSYGTGIGTSAIDVIFNTYIDACLYRYIHIYIYIFVKLQKDISKYVHIVCKGNNNGIAKK